MLAVHLQFPPNLWPEGHSDSQGPECELPQTGVWMEQELNSFTLAGAAPLRRCEALPARVLCVYRQVCGPLLYYNL